MKYDIMYSVKQIITSWYSTFHRLLYLYNRRFLLTFYSGVKYTARKIWHCCLAQDKHTPVIMRKMQGLICLSIFIYSYNVRIACVFNKMLELFASWCFFFIFLFLGFFGGVFFKMVLWFYLHKHPRLVKHVSQWSNSPIIFSTEANVVISSYTHYLIQLNLFNTPNNFDIHHY